MPTTIPEQPAASLPGSNGSKPDIAALTPAVKEDSKTSATPDAKPDSNAVFKVAPASAPPGDKKGPGKSAQQSKAKRRSVTTWLVVAALVATVAAATWFSLRPSGPGPGFASGNGRIEATEIDIASKLAGRIDQIMVDEGDFVQEGQVVAQMNTDVLKAQSDEARAQSEESVNAVSSDQAQVLARQADVAAARATITQKKDLVDAAQRRLDRFELLAKAGAVSQQDLDDDRASLNETVAEVATAQAQLDAALASVKAAQAQVIGAKSTVVASVATIARIEADIQDSQLKSPRTGRIQYRIAQPGEVLAAGGRVLNLIDLNDVYMTFFLPDVAVGKIKLGSEVHIILDAAPEYVIPATVSFVADVAQFTPKTVETASERQKLMFRVKAQISPDLLQKNLKLVKTGLPGVAWIKLDSNAAWPANLTIKVP